MPRDFDAFPGSSLPSVASYLLEKLQNPLAPEAIGQKLLEYNTM